MCRYMHMGLRTGHAKYDMIEAVLEEVGEVKDVWVVKTIKCIYAEGIEPFSIYTRIYES